MLALVHGWAIWVIWAGWIFWIGWFIWISILTPCKWKDGKYNFQQWTKHSKHSSVVLTRFI